MKETVKEKKKKPVAFANPIKKKSISKFFGIDKNEVDGLTFQKKVRNEWT